MSNDETENHQYTLLGYREGGYGETEYGGGGDGTEQAPYGGEPHAIPGRIEAEHFDLGGEGVAYHETDPPASWALDFRSETGVDVKRAPGTTDGISVGRFRAEEWLEYTVTVDSGTYTIRARVGTAHADRELAVRLDGQSVTTLPVPETGWSAHEVVEISELPIRSHAETHTLRLSPTRDGVDVDWVEFERTGDIMTETATVTLSLTAQHDLTATVTDDDGAALDGATVSIEPTDGSSEPVETTTDASGEAVFSDVPQTDLTVTATMEGYSEASATVAPSDFS